jgi:hydroxyethylthiazole kinase-like uncharacterized protein yjeF
MHLLDDAALMRWPLPQPDPDGDKEGRGRVLVVAGSHQMPGAAVLAATAALRAGAGKLVIATPRSAAPWVALAMPEARVIALDEGDDGGPAPHSAQQLADVASRAGAVLVGPGMLPEGTLVEFTLRLLPHLGEVPLLLDACALPAVQQGPIRESAGPVVVTPHLGEMARLTGLDKERVRIEAPALAVQHAQRWNAVVALKSAITYIATPEGETWQHDAGNIGLATSGSGDTLAGLIAGLLARGTPPVQATAWGVALHARAGEVLAERLGRLGYLAREIPTEVPALMQRFEARAIEARPDRLQQNLPL